MLYLAVNVDGYRRSGAQWEDPRAHPRQSPRRVPLVRAAPGAGDLKRWRDGFELAVSVDSYHARKCFNRL